MKIKNTNVSVARSDVSYTTVKGIKHVYPSVKVNLKRVIDDEKVTITRRFHSTTYGNVERAFDEATIFSEWAADLPNHRFVQVRRPIGRSRKSHYFATNKI